MKVIDISQYDGNVDFRQVRASGVEAVMLRSSWGHFVEDLRFRENVRKCNDAGLPYGLYHYSYALNESEMMREAEKLIALARHFLHACRSQSTWKMQTVIKKRHGTLYNKALNT